MKTTNYKKCNAQLAFEKNLYTLKNDYHLTSISQLMNDASLKHLYDKFMTDLSNIVLMIFNESKIHSLVNSIANANNNEYYQDVHNYAFYYESCSETLLSLFETIKKNNSENYGRVRIDVLFDDPNTFVRKLRYYIKNGILLDTARRYQTESKYIESITTTDETDDDEIINKIESVDYNRRNIENSFSLENTVISRLTYEPKLCQKLITAVIDRFKKRKPVAAFIYMMIMLEEYSSSTVIDMITNTSDFNKLFHRILSVIEDTYSVNLSMYEDFEFNATAYLESLKSLSNEKALKSRIDRLASDTRKIVHDLEIFKIARNDYVHYSKHGKTYSL